MSPARLLGALLVTLALVGPPGAAIAQGQDPATPDVALELLAVDAVVDLAEVEAAGPGDPAADPTIAARLAVGAGAVDRTDLRLVTTAYARVDDDAALQRALAGELPTVFSASSTAIADLPAGTTRVVDVEVGADELALLGGERAGVYPLTLDVFAGSRPVGSVTTAVIVLPAEDRPAPLPTTTLVRVHSDAAPLRGDTPHPSLVEELAPGGALDDLVADLARSRGDGSAAGLVLGVDARLLRDLAGLADGATTADGTALPASSRLARRAAAALAELRATARRADTEVVAHPYGPADLVALVRADLQALALDLVALGADSAAELLAAPVTADVLLPPDGLDAATLAALGPAGAGAVVLDEPYLAFAERDALHPVRRLRTADGGEVRVLVPDADLSALARDLAGSGPAAVVQQLRARTALAWLAQQEDPDAAAGVLLALDPLAGRPDAPSMVAATTDAVADAPWLRPVGLQALVADVRPSPRLVRLAYPPRSAALELPSAYTSALTAAVAALGPLSALLPDDAVAVSRYAASLDDAASTAYRDPLLRPLGLARAAEVTARLDALTAGVSIPESAPITLTATTGEVPVVVVNQSDSPLRLRASVQSARFAFPEGDTQAFALQPRSSTRLIFTAQARNPGGFAPIQVTVDDGAGAVLARQQLSVRSTAFPIVGLLATIGSAVVLVGWGVRQGRRRRRPGARVAADRSDAA